MQNEEQAREAIRRLVAEAEARQSDPDRFLPLHTPETVVVNFAGRRVLGGDALEQAMRQALRSPLAKVITRNEITDIRFVRPDVAIVSCVKHVFDERDGDAPALPATAGNLTYVVVRDQDDWRIALAQTTPIRAA
ncbi:MULTISPECIES: SgcJ/EcaC family oxidoreductase [Thermomonospora]|uniref:Uncharacterized protein (TIGR02246 family) n=1 Tax=Thermomonospora cellulosilytica TaxID=1411118 RepID=A0A7W3MUU7_9ACTN|nr:MULTISPECIES: SgcJ/EcaC family oxidoreductase [Thermomonospora]MBA9002242.1 uncharacterized protein (TIGR02246 family) [Thermomonospora cellulosilytica]